MEVSKKVVNPVTKEGEYSKIGEVSVPVFDLAEFGLTAATGVDEEGLPTYTDDKLQWVQNAVTAAIKAIARNKLVSGTASLKAGSKIAQTVPELLESNTSSGAALALYREFLLSFTQYLSTSGKSQAVQALYSGMVKTRAVIAVSSEARRNGLAAQLEAFLGSLNVEDQTKFLSIVETLAGLCESATDLSDEEL